MSAGEKTLLVDLIGPLCGPEILVLDVPAHQPVSQLKTFAMCSRRFVEIRHVPVALDMGESSRS